MKDAGTHENPIGSACWWNPRIDGVPRRIGILVERGCEEEEADDGIKLHEVCFVRDIATRNLYSVPVADVTFTDIPKEFHDEGN